jgi:hypothetical protein
MLPSDDITASIETQRSMLMAFFDYNRTHPEAPHRLYQDFPLAFRWEVATRCWKPRVNAAYQIGRIWKSNPFQGDIYYLRRLLTVVSGPQSFEELRCHGSGWPYDDETP